MKRFLLLSLLFPIALCAQFSQPVKDSVFSVLKYNSARYSITLGMQTADYVPASDTGFKNSSKDELLEKVTGSPADAPLYGAIAINAYYRDKDITTANQYIPRALGAYQEWINAEPANPTPVEKLLSFCLSINNYTAIPGLLDYALPRFPKHLPLLQQAAFYYLFGAGNTDKSQQVLNEAFAIAPGNITNLVYQTSIHQHRALADMGAGRTPHFPPIKQLDDALQAEPGNIALEHTDHYYRLSRIYFTGIARALKVNTDDLLVFNYFQLSETEKQYLDESAKWFSRQAKKKQANQYTLLHTLGVISCMQQEYDKASSFFEQAIRIKKRWRRATGTGANTIFSTAIPGYEGNRAAKNCAGTTPRRLQYPVMAVPEETERFSSRITVVVAPRIAENRNSGQ